MNLTTAHSLWLAPLCVLLGLLYAWVLYRRATEKQGWSRRLSLVLGALRATAVALIAFFLLEPMVRVWITEVRKPVVVIAHDGSASLAAAGDTAALRTAYKDALEDLAAGLDDRYQVRTFTYGAEVGEGLDFGQRGGQTDIDQLLHEVYDRFSGPDLGAVILDGDGIYNRGRDPRYAAERLGVPVYTIALGDTTVRPDLLVRGVDHNRIAFLGNDVPVVARVEARHLSGGRTRLGIRQGTEELAGQDLGITTDPFFTEVPLRIKPARPGLQRFTLSLRALEGEATLANNAVDFFIDVVDDRQKVLLLAAAPHPDIAALRQALDGLEGYETTLAYAVEFAGKASDFDLIVLHQLPSRQQGVQPLLQEAATKGVPLLFVLGGRTDMVNFSSLGTGVEVSGVQRNTIDAQAAVKEDFALFTLTADERRVYERFPPLQVPFGSYETALGTSALFTQRVGVVRTDQPLLVFRTSGERPMATVCGEGLWRWRMADHAQNGNTAAFDRLVHRTVQFLALKADKSRFRTRHASDFAEGASVIINAELYNPSYELVNTPDATITLKDEEGREYPFTFSRTTDAYRLDAGSLPAGRYTFVARTTLEGESFSATGDLLVQALVAERLSTVADHQLMAGRAAKTDGIMVRPDKVARIAEALGTREEMVARSYRQASFSDLIGLRWLFFVLLALLAAEWAIRRRSGAY